jgi:photosystem I subunit III|tara:strand:- start:2190 stop:2744 length:555 start_codon:yes stop_codon:yes gene_type:complete
MKRWLLVLLTPILLSATPMAAFADVSGLTPCKDSAVFKRRLDQSVKKLSGRLSNYDEGTPAYLALEAQIERTQARFDKYGKQGLLCGADGLPHLIADGRWSHAGEFILPGFTFLYIAGWIGWAGRSYLQFTKTTDKPNENEIIINVPVALGMMSSGFLWPLSAWNELVSGKLLVPGNEVTVSPR